MTFLTTGTFTLLVGFNDGFPRASASDPVSS